MTGQAAHPGEFDRRRSEPRYRLSLPVFVEAEFGVFDAEMLNISRGGALVRVTDPAFGEPPDDPSETEPYAEGVRSSLSAGISVHLFHGVLRMSAEAVRVADGSRGGRKFVLLGCRFRNAPEFGAWHPPAGAIRAADCAVPLSI